MGKNLEYVFYNQDMLGLLLYVLSLSLSLSVSLSVSVSVCLSVCLSLSLSLSHFVLSVKYRTFPVNTNPAVTPPPGNTEEVVHNNHFAHAQLAAR